MRHFDNFVLFFILLSTILLSLENPLDDPKGMKLRILNIIDVVMTSIFTLESLLKIVEYGLIFNGKKSYLRSSWNLIDFCIVIGAILSLVLKRFDFGYIKAIRMIRILRPMRVISRNEGLKVAVLSLLNSIPGLVNVMILSLSFFMLYGILGTNFFGGKFFSCHIDGNFQDPEAGSISKWQCLNNGGDWINRDGNFDDVFSSIMELFVLTTTEGWTLTMWAGVDAKSVNMTPERDHRPLSIFYFIFFIIIGSLFILNLFVGVVINTFN